MRLEEVVSRPVGPCLQCPCVVWVGGGPRKGHRNGQRRVRDRDRDGERERKRERQTETERETPETRETQLTRERREARTRSRSLADRRNVSGRESCFLSWLLGNCVHGPEFSVFVFVFRLFVFLSFRLFVLDCIWTAFAPFPPQLGSFLRPSMSPLLISPPPC